MIHATLTHVRDILNQHFKNEFSISENKVVLSNIVNADGGLAANVDGKIVFFLVNLDEKATIKDNPNRSIDHQAGSFAKTPPPLALNMHLLFCANFRGNNYTEGLRYLSSLIRFFQINSKIVPDQTVNLKPRISALTFEISKLDYSDLSHLWSAIGGKLMPSIVYKVSLLVLDDVPESRQVPPIQEPDQM